MYDLDDIYTPTDAELEFDALLDWHYEAEKKTKEGAHYSHITSFYHSIIQKQMSTIPF